MSAQTRKKIQKKLKIRGYGLKIEALDEILSFVDRFPDAEDEAIDLLLDQLEHESLKSSIIDGESVHRVISLLLEAEAATEEDPSSISDHSGVRVIDAFLVPKFHYDPIKKQFYQHTGSLPIHGDASAKAALYRDRFLLLLQRVSRDQHFSRPSFDAETSEFGSCEISTIQSLVGQMGRRWVMGVISQLEDGHFYLEDLTASVEIDLSKAKITTGFFSENTIVLAEGEMLIEGIFQNYGVSASPTANGNIFLRFMPEVLNALLNVLGSQPPSCALIQWHAGWLLQKLLIFQRKTLNDHHLHLFNASYQQSCERLRKEIDGCWFDHILETLQDEWGNCKKALEEPLQSKNPLFALELAVFQQTTDGATTSSAWQAMVDVVKVFLLHLQLKAFIVKGDLLKKLLLESISSPATDAGITQYLDLSSASFGSEVYLGSAFPCKIAFSNAGVRDIYLIPVSRGTSGRLILAEKHPFRSQRGVVIAIAPLAGLSPKKDDDHPTWLHLRIRELDPRSNVSKTRGHKTNMSNSAVDGRWTLGFTSAHACEAARLLILEETCKQKSFVESILAPLLEDDYIGDLL